MSESRNKSKKTFKKKDVHASKPLLTEESPFAVQEAYKALRTNIAFSLPGSGARCIAITSANRSEGKSTSAINVAISFGQIGKRVLLIDCDMRLPTIASKIDIEGQPGMSNILVGEDVMDSAIRTNKTLGIDILPAGTIPPDPTSLLESDQMGALLEKLKKSYEYIFIDLPPVITVTDALILSKHVDGFLLVVRHNASKYRDVSDMMVQLNFVQAKILGFIYHAAVTEKQKYYYYYNRT